MRLRAKKTVSLRGRVLGGDKPLLCIPVVSKDEISIESEIKKVMALLPDVIEWRADNFERVEDTGRVSKVLKLLRREAGQIPLIFTCRSHKEGGFRKIEEPVRMELIKDAITTGIIDAVDLELMAEKENIDKIKFLAQENKVALILSYHNFEETPSIEFLLDKITQQILYGADIAKIAVMPRDEEDVLELFRTTLIARRQMQNPLITMAMGGLGTITRAAGWLFGSDLTFGEGVSSSAAGQIPADELRMVTDILQKAYERQ